MKDVKQLSDDELLNILRSNGYNFKSEVERPVHEEEVLPEKSKNLFEEFYEAAPHALQSVASGATLGFSNKVQAAGAAGLLKLAGNKERREKPYSELYDEALKASGEINKKRATEHPIADITGEIVGGSILPWKTPGLAKTAKGMIYPALKEAPKTVKGALGLGAGYGAASGIGHNTDETVGSDILSAGIGAATGAPLAGGMQYLHNLPAVRNLSRKISGKATESVPEGLTPEMTENYELGKKYNVPLTKGEVTRNAQDLYNENYELGKKYNVPLTKGEVTRNAQDLYNEEMAGRGWKGNPLLEASQKFKETENQAFQDALKESQSKLTEGQTFKSKGSHAEEAIGSLTQRAAEEKKIHSNAYEQVNDAYLDIKNIKKFPEIAEESLQSSGVSHFTAPETYNHLKSFNSLFNRKAKGKDSEKVIGIELKALNEWKKNVSESTSDHKLSRTDKRGLVKLSNMYDDYVEDLVENSLISGDPKALEQLKHAKGLARDWFKKYGEGNPQEVGKNFVAEMVSNAEQGVNLTPEELVNKMLGMNKIGFGPQAANIVKTLKQHLTPEEFNAVKLEALERIMTPLKRGEANPHSGTYYENLLQLKKQNPTLVREFFGAEDLKTLDELGKLSKIIYTRPVNRIQPSGTAEFIGEARKLISKMPWAGQAFDFLLMGTKALDTNKTSFNPKVIEKQLSNPQSSLSNIEKNILLPTIARTMEEKEEQPEEYASGGKVTGKHYNYIMDEIIDMANNPIKETHIGVIKTWLKNFGSIYDLEKDKLFKQAYNYIDKVKNKGQIPIMLNYINQIPNVSKKKILEIRKAFIKAKNTKD